MKRRSEVTNPESVDLGLWKQKPLLTGVPFHLVTFAVPFVYYPPMGLLPQKKI